jgi:hypothetical protein
MKSATAIFVLCSTVVIGVLTLAFSGGLQDLEAATKSNDLTVDQILDRVENKYTNSKFSADFVQKSTIKAMDIC